MNTYYRRLNIDNRVIKIIVLLYGIIIIIFVLYLIFGSFDKYYYNQYKKYEGDANNDLQSIIKDVDKGTKDYYTNKISKSKMESIYEEDAEKLIELSDSFSYEHGDIGTRELANLKKQMILCYARVYEGHSKALEGGIAYGETEDMDFLKVLTDRYYNIDKIEMEKFDIDFKN